MPEELGLLLLILLAFLWGLFVFFRASFKVVGEFGTSLQNSVARWRTRRIEKHRTKLAPFVRVHLPNELARAEKRIRHLESELQTLQGKTWVVQRPGWEKKVFLKLLVAPQRALYSTMDVADLDSILRAESHSWIETESKVLAQNGTYPFEPPYAAIEEFEELSGIWLRRNRT